MLGHSMGGNLVIYISNKTPNILNKIVIVDIVPKKYKNVHKDILSGLKSIDFNLIGSRREADDKLSSYIAMKEEDIFYLKTFTGKVIISLGLDVI